MSAASRLAALRLSQKFTLVGILMLFWVLPSAILAVKDRLQQAQLAQAQDEGLQQAGRLLRVVQLTQHHRALSARALAGTEDARIPLASKRVEVQAAWDEIAGQTPKLEARWRTLAQDVSTLTLQGADSFRLHSALIGDVLVLLDKRLGEQGLKTLTDPKDAALVQAVLTHLPDLSENVGQARARGVAILGRARMEPDEREELAVLVAAAGHDAEQVRRALELAQDALRADDVDLWASAAAADRAVKQAIDLVRRHILRAGRLDMSSGEYLANMTWSIDRQYEFSEKAFKRLQDTLARKALKARMDAALLLAGLVGLGLLVGTILIWIARSTSRTLNQAVDLALQVAQGDLTPRVEITARDETGQLLSALQHMVLSLDRIVSQVRQGSEAIATSSSQIATGNADLSQRTEEQASSLQQTAASMDQFQATVRANAQTASDAAAVAQSARDAAQQGGAAMQGVVQTMTTLRDSSARIAEITGVIDGIAFQTNILALNASVEAARAGEEGKGFAVVADEVRSLAQRSAEAARQIKTLIQSSVDQVEAGVGQVQSAGQSITSLIEQVRQVDQLVDSIQRASQEQSQGIGQVTHAVNQLDDVTQRNAALVEEGHAATLSLQEQARDLAESVRGFRLLQTH